MTQLLRVVGLAMALAGLFLGVQALSEGSVSAAVFALAILAIGAYALYSSGSEGGSGAPTTPRTPAPPGVGPRPSPVSGTGLTKICPDCAEPVNAAARKCRYCGFMFDEATIIAPGPFSPPAPTPAPTPLPTSTSAPSAIDAAAVPAALLEGPSGISPYRAATKGFRRHGPLGPNGLRIFHPRAQIALIRTGLTWKYGYQWCSRCREVLQPQISAAGVIDPLFKCTVCGTLHVPTPRRP